MAGFSKETAEEVRFEKHLRNLPLKVVVIFKKTRLNHVWLCPLASFRETSYGDFESPRFWNMSVPCVVTSRPASPSAFLSLTSLAFQLSKFLLSPEAPCLSPSRCFSRGFPHLLKLELRKLVILREQQLAPHLGLHLFCEHAFVSRII